MMSLFESRRAVLPLALALIAAAPSLAVAGPFESILKRATVISPVDRDGMVAADFDGDGIDELVTAVSRSTPAIIVYANSPTPLTQRQVISLPMTDAGRTQLHLWQSPSGPRLVAVSMGGWSTQTTRVSVFGGWPLRQLGSHTLNGSPLDSRAGDVDADGTGELLALYNSELRATSLVDGQTLWTVSATGSTLALHNLDADPAIEILVSGTTGRVIDGATRLQEWSYPDGFGSRVAGGNVGPSGAPGFVGARDSSFFTVFRVAPWSPIWDDVQSRTSNVHIANLDGVGADEIITSDYSWGFVRIFDSQSRSVRREIQNTQYGLAGLATPRLQPGGPRHIALSNSDTYASAEALKLVHSGNGTTLRTLASETSGVTASALEDLDADGRPELILGSGSDWSGRLRIARIDPGAEDWVSPPIVNANEPLSLNTKRMLTAQLDNDPGRELVIVGDAYYDGRIVVMDGASQVIQLQIGDYSNSRPLAGRSITGSVLMDFDGDGGLDVVVSTEASLSSESGVRLHAFSLRTGALLWESIRMGSGYTTSKGLLLINDGSQRYLVAALTNGLRAFGVQSQLLEWTYTGDIDKAFLMEGVPGGPEIVLESPNGAVTHLDAVTRQARRSYSLPRRSNHLVAVPNAPYLVAAFPESLSLLRLDGSLAGEAEGVIANIGATPLAVSASAAGARVLVGTPYGYELLELNPEGLFRDGFDPR